MRKLIPVALCVALSACSLPHTIQYEKPTTRVPDHWAQAPGKPDAADNLSDLREWWKGFGDPVLDKLVDRALANNWDLKIASQRLLAARATRSAVAADRSPRVGMSGGSLGQRSSREVDWPKGIGRSDTQTIQLDASWEPDLFGRIQHSVDAADADIGIAEEDRRGILVSLLAEIATNYADLRSEQQRLAIAERNVAKLQETLETTDRLYRAGLANETSVALARAEVQTARATLPAWRVRIAQHIHATSTLVGGFPGDLQKELIQSRRTVLQLPSLPISLPSVVLRDRPDIREAERRLAGEMARTNVAISDLFPRFRIPLTFGTSSSGISPLFSAASTIWSVALTGSQTIFDDGQRQARIEAAKATTEGQRLNYERTIRDAFRDVEDALVSIHEEDIRQATLSAAMRDHQVAVDRVERERKAGTITYLELLVAQRSLYGVEDEVAASRGLQLHGLIALSKALGGGWRSVYPESVTAADSH